MTEPINMNPARMKRWLILGLILVGVGFIVPVPYFGPKYGPTVDRIFNVGHIYAFAFLAFILMQWVGVSSRFGRAVMVIAIVVSIGAAIEVVQPFFSRKASYYDVATDIVGGFIGVAFAFGVSLESRAGWYTMVGLAVAALFVGSYLVFNGWPYGG